MGTPTKAADNVYCIARKAAAEFNDALNSREGASELTGIERSRLARIELNMTCPYPDEVRLLSDAYNDPDLLTWYCTHDCQIGKCHADLLPVVSSTSLEQIAVKTAIALRGTEQIRDNLLDIAEDGVVDQDELPHLSAIVDRLAAISKVAFELQSVARKLTGGNGKC